MIVVFAGPTIGASEVAEALPGADLRPPARKGEIFGAVQRGASAIGLIDGFFEGVPSVWHKEILWALDQGIPVFGAASMGALRAAELHAFGMVGVGWIFEAYRDGILEDDDEVALRHGPPELGYVALCEPMVNIRATLDQAVAVNVVDHGMAADLAALAKGAHFSERSWERVLDEATHAAFDADAVERLRCWLPSGRVDQKHLDAQEMLSVMSRGGAGDAVATPPDFQFQRTVMWQDLTLTHAARKLSLEMRLVLDQLRGDPQRYQHLRRRAAASLEPGVAEAVPHAAVDRALTQFRSKERLFTGAALDAWLAASDLDLPALRKRLRDNLQLSVTISENRLSFHDALVAELKAEGSYEALVAEAKTMMMKLEQAGFPDPSPGDLRLAPATLLFWFFEELRGTSVPDDLEAFMRDLDFIDRSDFEQMMARAFVLWQVQV